MAGVASREHGRPRVNVGITAFNNGEVSPMLSERSDVEKYALSCRTLENMIPTVYGAVTRRPGTQYIATAKGQCRLIPFIYSATTAYICEFGDHYIRFYYGGASVAPEIVSPYAVADLPAVQYKQLGDVMWLVHPKYPPQKLTRTSPTAFAINPIVYEDGPFLVRNDIDKAGGYAGVKLSCDVTTEGATGIMSVTGAGLPFDFADGTIIKIVQNRANTTSVLTAAMGTTPSDPIPIKGTFNFITHDTWTATVVIERQENGGSWDTFRTYTGAGDRNISESFTEKNDGVYFRIHATSGELAAELTADSSTNEGIIRVGDNSGYPGGTYPCTILAALASTDASLRWAEGAWNTRHGYPSAIAFFEGRLIYAATTHEPQTIWFSAVDDFENFSEGLEDSDSFSIKLATSNTIRWIDALETLAVGTSGDEWRVASTKLEGAITPTNFNARAQSTYGSSAIQPCRCDMSVLFLDPFGRRVREFSYSADRQQYVAPDMTQMAEHVSLGGFTAFAFQRNPDKILWCVRSDGVLCSLTYERAENVIAWARHPMATGLTVESVAVIPGVTEDEVWLSIAMGGMRHVCRMGSRYLATQADSFFVDLGYGYSGGPKSTFTGLTRLNGKTVSILGDGAIYPDQIVAGGQVAIGAPVSKATIGLPYRYTIEPMRVVVPGRNGTSQGSGVRVAEVALSFYRTLMAQYGTDIAKLYDLDWRTTEPYGTAPALFTGDIVVTLDGGFDTQTTIIVSGDKPLPCTLRAIIARADRTGR